MNEHKLKEQVHDWLRKLVRDGAPIWFLKTHGGQYQRAGVPDYLLSVCGKFVAIELKSPEEEPVPTPKQAVELSKLERSHAVTSVRNSLIEVQRDVLGILSDQGCVLDKRWVPARVPTEWAGTL